MGVPGRGEGGGVLAVQGVGVAGLCGVGRRAGVPGRGGVVYRNVVRDLGVRGRVDEIGKARGLDVVGRGLGRVCCNIGVDLTRLLQVRGLDPGHGFGVPGGDRQQSAHDPLPGLKEFPVHDYLEPAGPGEQGGRERSALPEENLEQAFRDRHGHRPLGPDDRSFGLLVVQGEDDLHIVGDRRPVGIGEIPLVVDEARDRGLGQVRANPQSRRECNDGEQQGNPGSHFSPLSFPVTASCYRSAPRSASP